MTVETLCLLFFCEKTNKTMKNSTTAFLVFTFLMAGYYITDESHLFIGACIFISTYLIINQIKESYKK